MIDTTRDSLLTISNCYDSTNGVGFGPDGLGRARTDHILVNNPGFYRLSFSGDIEALSMPGGPTMVALEKEVRL